MVNNNSRAARGKNRLGIICGMAVIAVLAATLWPFNPFPRNRVHWLGDANGIGFDRPGVVISKAPLLAAENSALQSCALEILLKPAALSSLSTIANFYTAKNPGQFLLRQWTDGLLVSHDILGGNHQAKRSKIDVDHAFQVGKSVLLTIVSGANGTVVYTNGRQAKFFPRFRILPNELAGQIVIGTAAADYQPWAGEVRGLAIYSDELTPDQVFQHYKSWTDPPGVGPGDGSDAVALYSFTERKGREINNAVASAPDLEIPKNFEIPQKALLASPRKEFEPSRGYVKDLLQNIAGFVPLGFVFYSYLVSTRSPGKAILYAIVTAGTLSFTIEVLQAYIPQRNSGTTDIITNSLGAAIGAVLAWSSAARRFLEKEG